MFLQWMGAEYDAKRGLPGWDKKKHLSEVVEFFSNKCCYCAVSFSAVAPVEDHLIPMNKSGVGLHAWGNLVPACGECNAKKQGQEWKDFVIMRAGASAAERHQRIREFLARYKYEPDINDLRFAADDLYAEVGTVATALIETKIKRFKAKI